MATRLRDVEEIPKFADDFVEWLLEGKYTGDTEIHIVKQEPDLFSVLLYTDARSYYIVCKPVSDDLPKGLLMASMVERKPLAGEDWTRGNDLADGFYDKESFHRIMMDIVSCELVSVEEDISPRSTTHKEEAPNEQ